MRSDNVGYKFRLAEQKDENSILGVYKSESEINYNF